jgi:hypothetical protein
MIDKARKQASKVHNSQKQQQQQAAAALEAMKLA